MKIELVKGDKAFDRGERIIMVDGVRWGRTHVKSRGMHGFQYTFEQEHGDVIGRTSAGRFHEEIVRSASERHGRRFIDGEYRLPDDWKSTEELVHAKVVELVESGMLRDPKIVAAENEAASKRRAAQRITAQARENAAFEARAIKAAGDFDDGNRNDGNLVSRIVEAMRWAQEQ